MNSYRVIIMTFNNESGVIYYISCTICDERYGKFKVG